MTTQRTTKVQLKRVSGLVPGDVILPSHGLFDRSGRRIVSGLAETWGRLAYEVADLPYMNDVPEMNVLVIPEGDDAGHSVLHTPLDAYVVLAPSL